MRINADKIDALIHRFPVLILEMQRIETEMLELKQELLKSIEEGEDEEVN